MSEGICKECAEFSGDDQPRRSWGKPGLRGRSQESTLEKGRTLSYHHKCTSHVLWRYDHRAPLFGVSGRWEGGETIHSPESFLCYPTSIEFWIRLEGSAHRDAASTTVAGE